MDCRPPDAGFNNFGESIAIERLRYLLDSLLEYTEGDACRIMVEGLLAATQLRTP